jgi:8-oxo-dGTP pyrophosphatase MutT (NUDIX family)/2'-5' RNA ligase
MRVFGWSPTDMRQREDAFAALVDDKITNLGRHAVQIFKSERSIIAAGVPVAPVDLGSLGAITSMWKGYVQAELMPALSDVYLTSASVIWQGIDEAFDELVVPPVGDTFADEYLKNASNRLVGIGDRVWLKVREELLTGFSLGESVTKLADRVQTAANVSQARANVIARTEANMAANAGSFQQVLVSGLTGTKEWLDTSDERTRCSHRAAGGQTVNILETFKLGGPECGTGVSHLTVPGDPTAPPSEIIQCRCSVAFNLEMADESVVTAAAEVQTGAMIALLPIVEDAALMQLSGSYAEPADQLHVTLLYLGDAADWSANEQQLLQDVVEEIVEKYTMIETSTFSVNVFNPGSSEFDTAVVLGVRGSDLLVALHKAISLDITDVFDDQVPEQHVPWVPHITLAYTDNVAEVMPEAIDKLGTVTFDRVGVFFGGQVTEYPLGVQDPDDPIIAAAKHEFKEIEHPRGPDGKFIGEGKGFLKKLDPNEFDQLLSEKNIEFDLTPSSSKLKDLDAVPPSSLGKKGTKVKYPAPEGLPGLLNIAPDPGKSGDGYVTKTDGTKGPWGKYGASGVLLRHRGEDGVDRYLLVARGEKLSQSGKWQLPGGGLDSKETPAQGAAREIVEELGFKPEDVAKGKVHGFHQVEVPDTGGWKYTSIAATVPDQLVPDLSGENAKLETGDAKWLTVDEIQALDDNGDLLGPLANGQWKENMIDLFPTDEKTPEVPGSQPGGVDDVLAGDFTKLKKITGAKGSNEGGIFEAPDGTRWYVKKQKSAAHARNERDASALYREAGIDVPRVVIGTGTPELGGGTHTATQIIPEGDAKLGAVVAGTASDSASKLAAAREGFAMDALLANWDVAGLTYDNIIFDKNGKPYRIDVGGALEYRAQGTSKGSTFGTSVGEWDSLRSPSNPQAAKLFKGMSDSELAASVDHVEKLTPEKIREIVEDKKLADKLIARREDLLKRAEKDGVLKSMSGEVDFHPVDEHKQLDLGIAGKTDAELAAMVQTGHVVDDEPSVLTPLEAFKQHMADKEKMLAQPTVGKLSGKTFDYSDEPQNAIWQKAFLHGQHDDGDIILQGESLDGKQSPLQVVVRKDPVTGDPYLEELEYDFSDGSWSVGRTWHNEAEFNDASLEEYDVVKSKKSAFKSSIGVVPSTETSLTHPGPFSSTGAPHAKLWNQVGSGTYPEGYGTAGGISPHDGKYHRLTAHQTSKGWVLMDEVEGTKGEGDFYPLKTYYSLNEFGQADFSYMGIGKSSTSPGLVKSATTPSSVPAVLPKKVPKLTNAIIYGKHQNGDVIATSGDGFTRVIYQDNKIHIQLKNGNGTWVGQGYGKAEAYKKLQVNESGWFLGDVSPPSVSPPSLTPPSVSTPAVKTKSTGHDLKTTILHGNYEDGQIIATYKSNISSGESRWVWSAPNATFIKQSRVSKTGSWKTITKTQDPGKVIENVITLPSEGGVWSPGQKPKFGVDVPSAVTNAVTPSPTKGLNLVETIKQGKYNDGDVVGTYSKPGVGPQVRMIFSGGVFVKQTRPDNDSKWVTAKTYHTDDEAIESMNKGSGTWTKVDEPSGGLKPPPKVALMTTDVQVSFKKTFDDNAVKWHTSADKMLIALSETLKKHPEFTSAQVLSFMDSTTKTKTSPTPFTDKVTKYLKTSNGFQQAKLLGIPGVHTKAKPKTSTSYSYPSTPTKATKVTPTVTIIHEPPPPSSVPGTYKIQTISEMDALHNVMTSQHGEWTSTQVSALKAYTGSSYVNMNGCLRDPKKCTSHVLTMIKNAQDGMKPIPKPVRVTRGAGWSAVGLGSEDIGHKSDAERIALLQALEGKAVQEPGFLSTSSSQTPAFSGKPVLFEIDVPVGTPVAWVKKISGYKSENELLLAPGLKYRIKKVTPPSGYGPVRVHLEVILP